MEGGERILITRKSVVDTWLLRVRLNYYYNMKCTACSASKYHKYILNPKKKDDFGIIFTPFFIIKKKKKEKEEKKVMWLTDDYLLRKKPSF